MLVFIAAHQMLARSAHVWKYLAPRRVARWVITSLPANPITLLATKGERVETLLRRAHLGEWWTVPKIARMKEVTLWCGVALLALLWTRASLGETVLLGVLLVAIAFFGPEVILSRRARAFERAAERGLIHIIELLRLHVAAGMNLDRALRNVATHTSGVWGDELQLVVRRLDAGLTFDDALVVSAERFRLPDLNRFLAALKQSRQLGASLGATLGVQSQLLRTRRKFLAETTARTAAVKIALPLVLCIFPALLVIYLAPAVLRVASGL